jgi:ATP-dependent protease ClpP protease subunit
MDGITDRSLLLGRFKAEFIEQFGHEPVTEELQFIARLVKVVPSEAFENADMNHQGLLYMIGNLDVDDEDGFNLGDMTLDALRGCHREAPLDVPISIRMSCDGGSVMTALAIQAEINHIRREGRKVNCHVIGYALSAAFDILQHCDYRTAEPEAGFMTHEEQYGVDGSSTQILKESQFSKKMERTQYELLSLRTGRPAKYYVDKVAGKEWHLTAPEALAEGLIDAILEVPPLPKSPAMIVTSARRKRKEPNEPAS